MIDRRTFLASGAATLSLTTLASAHETPSQYETVNLWPDGPAGLLAPDLVEIDLGKGDPLKTNLKGIRTPRLTVLRADKPNGTGILIAPGGSYARQSFAWEGIKVARWLNSVGITAFILTYRLPAEGWQNASDVPLADAQRAIRLIRAKASGYAVDPSRIGMLGFSAGGHLCASLATRFAAQVYTAVDEMDSLSARPDLAAPIYPVVTMHEDFVHMGSRENLIGKSPTEDIIRLYSPEDQVTPATPPTFLVHGEKDIRVPPENSLQLRAALKRAGVPVELHLYPEAAHGFSLADDTRASHRLWPQVFLAFAQDRKLIRT